VAEPTGGRRTFGPVVLAGLLSAGALAFSGTQPWFGIDDDGPYECTAPCAGVSGTLTDAGTVVSANALALVGLACWGVVLVTRGRFRRAITVVGLLAAVGAVVTVIASYPTVPDDVREWLETYGSEVPAVGSTGWYWVGAAAALLLLLTWIAAFRFVSAWPEMGSRYDTPSDSPPEDLWKAMDQGHDPTS
jgi:hypothetical protein